MKNFKFNLAFTFLIGILIFPAIEGCKKYPEGPSISARSKAARIANSWRVESYSKNGLDQTADFMSKKVSYIETFTKDNRWSYTYINPNDGKIKAGDGNWRFLNDDKQILITEGSDLHLLTILKLKEKEFWFYYTDGDDRKEFHLMQ